jgi:hypothetical protein
VLKLETTLTQELDKHEDAGSVKNRQRKYYYLCQIINSKLWLKIENLYRKLLLTQNVEAP